VKEKESPDIRFKANGKKVSSSSRIPLLKLKDLLKPNINVIVYSGFPLSSAYSLKQRNEIGHIWKREIPSLEEFGSLLVARHTPQSTIKVTSCLDAVNRETERQDRYQE
jgi:hypothetical protein